MVRRSWFAGLFLTLFASAGSAQFEPSGFLEVHYINVGQGGCTLIIGPDGTTILYDFGKVDGAKNIVPYLQKIGLTPEDGISYAILSHRDTDHFVGFKGVVEADYGTKIANFDSGSPKDGVSISKYWLDPAEETPAGTVRKIPVGMRIPLGDGAEVLVVAANGKVFGESKSPKVVNENDRSVALFVHYRNFQYVLDGDLGGGPEDCTEHDTDQRDVQSRVARRLLAMKLISPERGVDVLHIAHHGSESSTSAVYYNLMRPEVGLISVGLNQGTFLHPREDVLDKVLLGGSERADCVTAPPLIALFQTEDGVEGESSTGRTSFSGMTIGDIKLTTDGETGFTVEGNYRVHGWVNRPAGLPSAPAPMVQTFALDETN